MIGLYCVEEELNDASNVPFYGNAHSLKQKAEVKLDSAHKSYLKYCFSLYCYVYIVFSLLTAVISSQHKWHVLICVANW